MYLFIWRKSSLNRVCVQPVSTFGWERGEACRDPKAGVSATCALATGHDATDLSMREKASSGRPCWTAPSPNTLFWDKASPKVKQCNLRKKAPRTPQVRSDGQGRRGPQWRHDPAGIRQQRMWATSGDGGTAHWQSLSCSKLTLPLRSALACSVRPVPARPGSAAWDPSGRSVRGPAPGAPPVTHVRIRADGRCPVPGARGIPNVP